MGTKAGIKDATFHWPGKRVPYYIDPSVQNLTQLIEEAIAQYHKHTVLRFVKRTDEQNYVCFLKDKG
ncbi:hypothetical protein TNIN_157921 [Trichonephila inaurata madagascariensis]|uniref:Peptidase M12A domain-containing protein n=1 Tax=Trichonephila inaurata madagascariensis TaxID=2747483 RepID=A0A8X6XBN2_9ARAC|nr:hypothetical protein TNIN_157921 [Trichonephila inaurata madagascariensis]